ncbi:hypothetical protein AVEN_212297-1 [Araneus ventricosus]|uniref:Reverse transcriptase domain-containing protein n=1 Tax=Araneus ventricosus TaxID=182803 RepID=A0A4Y2LIR5_ARAVE|nr:hypothetical protein AVEN_212297-1 [Araneus ventricosus]
MERRVIFSDGIVCVEREYCIGCPKGSVVALTQWNIYINAVLNLNNDQHYIQEFADDLTLVTTVETRRELESNTNCLLHLINDKLQELKLELSTSVRESRLDLTRIQIIKEQGNPFLTGLPVLN